MQFTISFDAIDGAYVITYPLGSSTAWVTSGMQNKPSNRVKLFKTIDSAKKFIAKNYPDKLDTVIVK